MNVFAIHECERRLGGTVSGQGSQKGLVLQDSRSELKNAGLQDRKIVALGLHRYPPGLHLARISIFIRLSK